MNADLRACVLDESELPNGWSKGWPAALPRDGKPIPTGMLGGLFTPFSHQGSSAGMPAFHELHFYERTFRAVYLYKIRRIGYLSRWQRTWLPLDLSQANLSADEYRAKCSDFVPDIGPGRGESSCETKARYGRFISVFHAEVSHWDMSMEEYIQVLQAFDRLMLQCVDSFRQGVGRRVRQRLLMAPKTGPRQVCLTRCPKHAIDRSWNNPPRSLNN